MYNAQEYIASCLYSCINQTFKNFEILLIDDSSVDDSVKIADEILRKSFIQYQFILQKSNVGVAKCRNEGICRSTGKYLLFLDADDVLDENALGILFNVADKHEFPVVFCKYNRFIKESEIKQNNIIDDSYRKISIRFETLQERLYAGTIWGGLIKRSVIEQNKLRFIEGLHYGEDTIFKTLLIHDIDFLVELDSALYWWRITPGSLSSKVENKILANRERVLIEYAIKTLIDARRKPLWDGMMIKYIRAKKNSLYDYYLHNKVMPIEINKKIPIDIVMNMKSDIFFKLIEAMYVLVPFLDTWKIQKYLFWLRKILSRDKNK